MNCLENLKGLIITNLEKLENLSSERLILIPPPQHLIHSKKNCGYSLKEDSEFYFFNTEKFRLILDDINDALDQFCALNYEYSGTFEKFNGVQLKNRINEKNLKGDESYRLIISNNMVTTYSKTDQGLFYGVQTLIQIFKNGFLKNKIQLTEIKEDRKHIVLPEIEIIDYPDLDMRGVTEDIARGQVFTVESAKRFIKIYSHYKLNTFCPCYLQDMIINPEYPNIGKNRGALSVEEIREINKYAKERFVNFFPIYNCIGHQDNIFMIEDYWNLAEFPGSGCVNVSNPEIFPFLKSYIEILSEAFSSKWFHIGCDESFDLGTVRSRDLVEKEGKGKVLIDFYNKIYEMVTGAGKDKIVMYHDIPITDENILENLNKNIILMYWEYTPWDYYKDLDKLLDAGFKVIVSPSMLNWCRNFPDNIHASKNIINLTKQGIKNKDRGVIGMLNSIWGDHHYYSFRENTLFGGILGATVSWNSKFDIYKDIVKTYGFLFYGLEEKHLENYFKLFNTLSSIPKLYKKVSILLPPLFFTYLFKHPITSEKIKPPFDKYEVMEDMAIESLRIYEELENFVKFNKENFEYIKFGAELAQILSEKIKTSISITNLLKSNDLNDELREKIILQLEEMKNKFTYLKKKYEELWLRSAKRPCLDQILILFDFVINAYDKKIEELNQNIQFVDPYLESKWIWVKEFENPPKPRYFRKVIKIDQNIKKAIIQGIAGNYIEIYVNGTLIGKVLSRFSLHIVPIARRVKAFDITNLLKKGNNVIAIKGINYQGFGGAFNIFGQILLDNNSIQEFYSDKSWVCYKKEEFSNDSWSQIDFNDKRWSKVKSFGRPPNLNGDIIKPDLLKGEYSLTQDYFGATSYIYSTLGALKHHFGLLGLLMYHLARRFIRFIVKKINLYG